MGFWRQVAEYLYIKKKDPAAPHNQSIRFMHGVNRLSLIMATVGIIIVIIRWLMKKH